MAEYRSYCPVLKALLCVLVTFQSLKAVVVEVTGDGKYPIQIQTCREECGLVRSVPCSCDARCFVLGNCCMNITEDCPAILEEASHTFGTLIGAQVYCQNINTYVGVIMVESCPSVATHDVGSGTCSKELEVGLYERNLLRNEDPNLKSLMTPGPETDSKRQPETSLPKLIENAFNNVPVTELTTGITFINRSVYECCEQLLNTSRTASRWTIKTPSTLRQTNPVTLDELELLLAAAEPKPGFDTDLLHGGLCLTNAIDTCETETSVPVTDKSLHNNCLTSATSYVTTLPLSNMTLYRNHFCLVCNKGDDTDMMLWAPRVDVNTDSRSFFVLFQLSPLGDIVLSLENGNSLFPFQETSWTETKCSFNIVDQDNISEETSSKANQLLCRPTCEPSFVERPDGLCKGLRKLVVATPDIHGYRRLCPKILHKLAKFIQCGLQNWTTYIEISLDSPAEIRLHVDDRMGEVMLVAEILLYRTTFAFKIYSNKDIMSRLVSLLSISVQAFHKVCRAGLGMRSEASSDSDTQNIEMNTNNTIMTVRADSLEIYKTIEDVYEKVMDEMRGERIVNTSGRLLCYSEILDKPLGAPLECVEDGVRAQDEQLVDLFLNSTCFATFAGSPDQIVNPDIQQNDARIVSLHRVFPISSFYLFIVFLSSSFN